MPTELQEKALAIINDCLRNYAVATRKNEETAPENESRFIFLTTLTRNRHIDLVVGMTLRNDDWFLNPIKCTKELPDGDFFNSLRLIFQAFFEPKREVRDEAELYIDFEDELMLKWNEANFSFFIDKQMFEEDDTVTSSEEDAMSAKYTVCINKKRPAKETKAPPSKKQRTKTTTV